jgi:hypothetical protein
VRITARLEEATVKELLGQLLPAKVFLDEQGERWIQIERANHIDFVAGRGLRVASNGEVRWQAAGVPITFTFLSAQLMLQPLVVEDDHGGRLVFRPSLEDLDLKNVPSFLDSGALSLINKRLEAQGDALAWHFGQTLARAFPMPDTLTPVDQLKLGAGGGHVDVLDDAVIFTLDLALEFLRARA